MRLFGKAESRMGVSLSFADRRDALSSGRVRRRQPERVGKPVGE
jgi:hypothetical protein